MPTGSSSLVRFGKRRTRAAAVSVGVAIALVIIKVAAGVLTNSLSMLASAVDSLTDIFASAVNFVAIRAASRPADREHVYGHGKAEGLAGLFQSVVIGLSGAYLGYQSVMRIIQPQTVEAEAVGVSVMAVSMAASYLLVRYLRKVARETGSLALEADSLHYTTDVLANGAVLVLLVVVGLTGMPILDPIASLAISLYILWAAIGVFRSSIDHLMDRALPDDMIDIISGMATSHANVRGVHDIRTRVVGSDRFIELHLEMDGQMLLRDSHQAAVEVLQTIEREVPNSRVFVHVDPVDVSTPAAP